MTHKIKKKLAVKLFDALLVFVIALQLSLLVKFEIKA